MTIRDQESVAASTAVSPGTELNQTYLIDSLIGVGGMGEVYRGHNIQTGDPVAIKIVLPEYARDEMILELFRKEARILNHLSHDAIVRYYVFSIDRVLGRPYLAMEYVDGPSLAERIKAKPLSIKDVEFLQKRLADGLQRAHEAGVIHRDMSPDNVILPSGSVEKAKIIDFGIARSANVGGGTLLGGSFAGKYNFVSPEQLGLFGGEVTPQSDIYSLGLVLAAALRGRPIDMSGTQVEVIEKRRVVPDLSDIDPDVRELLERMLQPDPANRFPSMSAVRDWKPSNKANSSPPDDATVIQPPPKVQKALASPKTPPPIPKHAKSKKPETSGRWGGVLFGVLAILVIAGGAFGGWYYVETSGLYLNRNETKNDAKNTITPTTTQNPTPKPETSTKTATDSKPLETDKTALKKDNAQLPAKETKPPVTEQKPPEQAIKLPPQPTVDEKPKPVQTINAAAELTALIEGFNGGKCFYSTPQTISDKSAMIVGYSNKQEPFNQLDSAIKAKSGFEPDIQARIISDPQCEVVNALRRLTSVAAIKPSLKLNKANLRMRNAQQGQKGDILEGTVTGLGDRTAEVLLVDNEGGVQNIRLICSTCVQRSGDQLKVRITLNPPAENEPQTGNSDNYRPMLLLALASTQPLKAISSRDLFPAAEVFPQLAEEIASTGGTATAIEYFKLVNSGN